MTESGRNFWLGLASLGGLVALSVLLLRFGELDRFFHPRYLVTLDVDDAGGVRTGSAVERAGVPIGVVDEIAMRPGQVEHPVRLALLIDYDVRLPETIVPYTASSLLGGSARLELVVDADEAGAALLKRDGSATLTAVLRSRMIDTINDQLDRRMKPLLDAFASFQATVQTYGEVGEDLKGLFGPQDPAALGAGGQPNVRTTVAQLYDVLSRTQEALELARAWLGDEQLRTQTRQAVTKATELIDRATETLDGIQRLTGSLETDADELVKRASPVLDELGATLDEVHRLTRLAREGSGTVGLLLNNPDLYHSLEATAEELQQVLREFRLYLEKVKAEGVDVNL